MSAEIGTATVKIGRRCHVEAVLTRRDGGLVLTDLLVNGQSLSSRIAPAPVLYIPAEGGVEHVDLSIYVDQITVAEGPTPTSAASSGDPT